MNTDLSLLNSASEDTLIIIQSRLHSKRLPAKALLPIQGMPMVVLCAKRASNTGLPTIVATSELPGNELMLEVLTKFNVPCFSGHPTNVLYRYLQVISKFPQYQIVVRLTADNLLPDGALVGLLVSHLKRHNLSYVRIRGDDAFFPKGLSAEAFTVEALKKTCLHSVNAYQEEHVTPWMIENLEKSPYLETILPVNIKKNISCSVDTLEEYILLSNLFKDIESPTLIGWEALIEKLNVLCHE